MKPFTMADRWLEQQTPPWDTGDTFDIVDSKGEPIPNPDVYIPPGQPGATGFNSLDVGLQVRLSTKIELPGSSGAKDFHADVVGCSSVPLTAGDALTPLGGKSASADAVADLIAQDPTAFWDASTNSVRGSAFSVSPRVAVVPVYDPVAFALGKQNGKNVDLVVVNFVGVFIEGVDGEDVVARITPVP